MELDTKTGKFSSAQDHTVRDTEISTKHDIGQGFFCLCLRKSSMAIHSSELSSRIIMGQTDLVHSQE